MKILSKVLKLQEVIMLIKHLREHFQEVKFLSFKYIWFINVLEVSSKMIYEEKRFFSRKTIKKYVYFISSRENYYIRSQTYSLRFYFVYLNK